MMVTAKSTRKTLREAIKEFEHTLFSRKGVSPNECTLFFVRCFGGMGRTHVIGEASDMERISELTNKDVFALEVCTRDSKKLRDDMNWMYYVQHVYYVAKDMNEVQAMRFGRQAHTILDDYHGYLREKRNGGTYITWNAMRTGPKRLDNIVKFMEGDDLLVPSSSLEPTIYFYANGRLTSLYDRRRQKMFTSSARIMRKRQTGNFQ